MKKIFDFLFFSWFFLRIKDKKYIFLFCRDLAAWIFLVTAVIFYWKNFLSFFLILNYFSVFAYKISFNDKWFFEVYIFWNWSLYLFFFWNYFKFYRNVYRKGFFIEVSLCRGTSVFMSIFRKIKRYFLFSQRKENYRKPLGRSLFYDFKVMSLMDQGLLFRGIDIEIFRYAIMLTNFRQFYNRQIFKKIKIRMKQTEN